MKSRLRATRSPHARSKSATSRLERPERIRQVLKLLTRQLEILKMRERINSQIKEEMGKNQREYVLRQQLKAIKEELGEEDGDGGDLDALEERITKADLPQEADQVSRKQLKRLRSMQVGSAEYTVVRTYIDWILDIPWRKGFKMSASVPVAWGVTVSMALQSNQSPNSTRVMTVTRGATRYPSTCPAPCPAGEIIMPTAVFGQATATFNLLPSPATFVERINQLDLKVQKTFRFGRMSVIPTYEVFNLNNSDAIISYQTTNALAAGYLRPNSIMQGTIHGVGLMVRW